MFGVNPIATACRDGDIDAPAWYGHAALYGRFDEPVNYTLARNYLQRAAAEDHPIALRLLSVMGDTSPLAHTCRQVLLGDDAFVSAHQQSQRSDAFKDTPRQQRRAVTLSLAQYQANYSDRDEAIARAYLRPTNQSIAGPRTCAACAPVRSVAGWRLRPLDRTARSVCAACPTTSRCRSRPGSGRAASTSSWWRIQGRKSFFA
jgi:hypothetical protein